MNELLVSPAVLGNIVVVDSGHSEDYSQWYRIYSDNFCIQGGCYTGQLASNANRQIILMKEYVNTNYIVTANFTNASTTDGSSWTGILIYKVDGKTFHIINDGYTSSNNGGMYITMGYVK